jgi:hypothetical protein
MSYLLLVLGILKYYIDFNFHVRAPVNKSSSVVSKSVNNNQIKTKVSRSPTSSAVNIAFCVRKSAKKVLQMAALFYIHCV